jgi:hypothetical protein
MRFSFFAIPAILRCQDWLFNMDSGLSPEVSQILNFLATSDGPEAPDEESLAAACVRYKSNQIDSSSFMKRMIARIYGITIEKFCNCRDARVLRKFGTLQSKKQAPNFRQWTLLAQSLESPDCQEFAKQLARGHFKKNQAAIDQWHYWFDPMEDVLRSRPIEKLLHQAAYEELVMMATASIDERLKGVVVPEGPVGFFHKFVSYYSEDDGEAVKKQLLALTDKLVCFPADFQKYGPQLIAQRVITKDTERVITKDFMCSKHLLVKCPDSEIPFIPLVTDEKKIKGDYDRILLQDCNLIENVKRIHEDINWATLDVLEVIKKENKSTSGKGSVQQQFENEKSQMIEICSEVLLLYTSFGRNPKDGLFGRSVEDCEECWRKYSYPTKEYRKPFRYYKGLGNTCGSLLYFSRKSAGSSVSERTPATYPPKHEVYNMMAAIVEDVSDLFLGPNKFRIAYYKKLLEVIFSEICVMGFEAVCIDLSPITDDFAGYFENVIILTGLTSDLELNVHLIPKIWGFIFGNGGHSGLVAVAIAVMRSALNIPETDFTTPVTSLYEFKKIDEMLDLAASLVDSLDWEGLVNRAERNALRMTRPTSSG